MIGHILRNALCRTRLSAVGMTFLAVIMICAIMTPHVAAQEPKPDPAGIATGDRTTVLDAAGTPFVVTEPTDKSAPDYADKRKAFDEFQAQVAKEPLAARL